MRVSRAGLVGGIAALLVAAICIRLGFWQLDRLEQRREFNAAASAALAMPPLRLDSAVLDQIEARPEAFVHRRAVVTADFSDSAEVLLRGRSHDGRPGVHLVSTARLPGDARVILVNRGWLPSPDAATVDPRPFAVAGSATFEGTLQLIPDADVEPAPAQIEVSDTTFVTYRRLDYDLLNRGSGAALLPLYLEVVPAEPIELPIPVPLPTFDEGSHLGYAIQWFSFAAIALLGFALVVLGRQRGWGSGNSSFKAPPAP